jgi:HSP20 family protein
MPYDMLKNLIYFHDRINNLFEARLKSLYSTADLHEGASWSPAVDFYEKEGGYVVTAELPGVDLKDVRIEVADNELIISGSRPCPREGEKDETYLRLEGSYGVFERRFVLPGEVERQAIKARLKDGVLKVSIPRAGSHRVTTVFVEDR